MERRTVAGAGAGAAATVEAPRQLPPGFRFHPTDEELVLQYLRRKALARPLPAAVIPVVHGAASLDPWDLPGASEREAAYFFCLRQAPASGGGSGGRRRRAGSGYWKATGKEKPVFLQGGSGCGGGKRQQLVGVKTALAFHRGKAPSSPTGWVMHEYRLALAAMAVPGGGGGVAEQKKSRMAQPGEWVVCRVSLKNRARRPATASEAGSQTPGHNRAAVVRRAAQHREDAGLHQPLLPSSTSSSSSCVTDGSDQEVSSVASSIDRSQ